MAQATQQAARVPRDIRPKWLNSCVQFHQGTLAEVRAHIPAFERRSFSLLQPGDQRSRLNERLDAIVRLPFGGDPDSIPVGVVSKDYALIPHEDVLAVATKALEDAGVAPGGVKAKLALTEYGERMAVSLFLPADYAFDPGDGHPMALRLECLNSVDGSTRFRALMGWFRLICSNGMIIGVTRTDLCRRHVGDLRLEDVGAVLESGFRECETEKGSFGRWRETGIGMDRLGVWVDEDVRRGWGFKAAARAYHIACSGFDAEIVGQYKDSTPTSIETQATGRVPGAPEQCSNLFDLSQILAWLAKERRDLHEQLEWREMIPALMKPLLN